MFLRKPNALLALVMVACVFSAAHSVSASISDTELLIGRVASFDEKTVHLVVNGFRVTVPRSRVPKNMLEEGKLARFVLPSREVKTENTH